MFRRTKDRLAYVLLTFAVAIGVVVVLRYVLAAGRSDGPAALLWLLLAAGFAWLTVDALRRRRRHDR
jgi:hypothetical protein